MTELSFLGDQLLKGSRAGKPVLFVCVCVCEWHGRAGQRTAEECDAFVCPGEERLGLECHWWERTEKNEPPGSFLSLWLSVRTSRCHSEPLSDALVPWTQPLHCVSCKHTVHKLQPTSLSGRVNETHSCLHPSLRKIIVFVLMSVKQPIIVLFVYCWFRKHFH